MRALTIEPEHAGTLKVRDVDDVEPSGAQLLVEGLLVGVCGTDHELASGSYGWAPPGRDHLIIGHESLGRVTTAPPGSDFHVGDLVAGVVRRPDPVPCGACGHGQFDMCRNGQYTERGIKELDGFASQQWVSDPRFTIRLDPKLGDTGVLLEPTSVVAKAWAEIEAVGHRSWFEPRTALVVGAGPIGLLATLLGVQRDLEMHVADVVRGGVKPRLVGQLEAQYHHDDAAIVLSRVKPDIVIDTTGLSAILAAVLQAQKPYQITCLLGMHEPTEPTPIDLASVGKTFVLDNAVVLGSVNANVEHWRDAADALAAAPSGWLRSIISRTVPLSSALDAFERQDDDVKVVIDIQS